MAYKAWTEEECINHFQKQEKQIRQQINEGEDYKHCLDKESFNGSYYDPMIVITSEGRIWSLYKESFLKLGGMVNAHGYLRVKVSKAAKEYNHTSTTLVHNLVANYFCDKKLIEIMEEDYTAVQVHHINHDKTDNRAENLQYVSSKIHDILTALHLQNSTASTIKNKSLNKLDEYGLNNPCDSAIKTLVNNATNPGVKLYGFLVKDEESPNGYHFEIKENIPI